MSERPGGSEDDFEARVRADLQRAAESAPPLRWSPPRGSDGAEEGDVVRDLATARRRRGVRLAGAVVAAAALVAAGAVGAVVVGGLGTSPEQPPAAVESPTGPGVTADPGTPGPSGGMVAGACAFAVEFEDRTYVDAGAADQSERGRSLGEGVLAPCEDTGGQPVEPEVFLVAVHELVGVPTTEALWVDGRRVEVQPQE